MSNSFKLLAIVVALSLVNILPTQAQVDLKTGPLGPIFGTINLRAESGFIDNAGLEASIGAGWSTYAVNEEPELRNSVVRLGMNVRYYFNPSDLGRDNFYFGTYGRYSFGNARTTDPVLGYAYLTNRLSVGFLTGIKFFARNERLHFDFNVGIGRAFIHNFESLDGAEYLDRKSEPFFRFDLPISMMMGYRIGRKY